MKRITTKNDFIKDQRKQKITILLSQLIIVILFFSLWELFSNIGIINVFLYSKPSRFINTFIMYAKEGLFHHVYISSI